MQAFGGPGAGVVALTYGPTVSPFIHDACMEMSLQCAERQMPYALCFDPWTCSKNGVKYTQQADIDQAMILALNHPDTKIILNSRSYLPARPSASGYGVPVLDFATGCNRTTVQAACKNVQLWMNGPDFSWPRFPGKTSNAVIQLPCVCLEFNDGTGKDRNVSATAGGPARIIPALSGGFWNSLVATLPATLGYVQVITWNDVSEGTDVEKIASALY